MKDNPQIAYLQDLSIFESIDIEKISYRFDNSYQEINDRLEENQRELIDIYYEIEGTEKSIRQLKKEIPMLESELTVKAQERYTTKQLETLFQQYRKKDQDLKIYAEVDELSESILNELDFDQFDLRELSKDDIISKIKADVIDKVYQWKIENRYRNQMQFEQYAIETALVEVEQYISNSNIKSNKQNFLHHLILTSNHYLSFGGGDRLNPIYQEIIDDIKVTKNIALVLNDPSVINAYRREDIDSEDLKKIVIETLKEKLEDQNNSGLFTFMTRQTPTKIFYDAVKERNANSEDISMLDQYICSGSDLI